MSQIGAIVIVAIVVVVVLFITHVISFSKLKAHAQQQAEATKSHLTQVVKSEMEKLKK